MQRRFVRTTPISPYEPAHGDILTAGKRPLVAQVGPFAEFPLFGPCTGAKVGEANKRADSIAVPVAFGQLQLLTGRLSVGAHVPGTGRSLPTLMLGVVALGACGGSETDTAADEPVVTNPGSAPDTTGAAIWAHIQGADYRTNWNLWPDKGQFYAGGEPHGMLLTTYMNDAALGALNARAGVMPEGAVVIKENYMPDSTLAAVTVMYKRPGYNAEHNDWFFTKHQPDGSLFEMPNGMAMEGRLPGCQNCHLGVKANDYLFTAPITGN